MKTMLLILMTIASVAMADDDEIQAAAGANPDCG
jgi:hypothetical protein